MNRGSDLDSGALPLQANPSMRPRFMNRGSTGGLRAAVAASLPFNEAPIHESGKSGGNYVAGGKALHLQ